MNRPGGMPIAYPNVRFGLWLLLAMLVACFFLFLWYPVPLQYLRNAAFDQFQRWQPRTGRDGSVVVIDIDDESLARLGQWPWPRSRLAELVSKLQSAKPAVIALDMIFAEADRTSPKSMLELWPLSPENRRLLSLLPDHDDMLADVIGRGKVVLGFALSHSVAPKERNPAIKARFISLGNSPASCLARFDGVVASLPQFEKKAQGNGALNFMADADGIIRKVPILLSYRSAVVPSLAAEVLRVSQNAGNYTIRSAPGPGCGIGEIRIGRIAVPTAPNGEIWIHYAKPDRTRYISAWKILSGRVDPAGLQGRILLVGASAQGILDMRFSPLGDVVPGIEIHAQALEQMLSGTPLLRPGWTETAELLTVILIGSGIGLLALNAGALFSFSVFLLVLVFLWAGAWQAFSGHHLLLDPMAATVLLALVYLISSIFRHVYSERRQRWVKQAFARYISPNLVDHLIACPDALELGGRRQNCSFVFSDLTDFTGLMESMDPGEAVTVLNGYLDRMIAIAFAHQGTLDRIVGDAVAILFSAPIRQPDHECRALRCALAMHRFAEEYAAKLNARGIPFGKTRIGVHTGEVIVGNFGGRTFFDYRALGDPVNTASRLEHANKYLGTSVCLSEATLAGCADFPVRPIGRLRLKGKAQPLLVFELLNPGLTDETELNDYLAAYRLMCEADPTAAEAFRNLLARHPSDGLAAFHLKRLAENHSGDLIELTEK